MSNRFNKAALLTGTVMAGAMLVTPAYAQEDTGSEGELIVVTGSRIAQRNIETAAPIAVVDDAEFKLTGTVNVENVINALPQVVPGFTSNSNNPGNGTATLNLRGLGSNRTMVLVNGRRWMFSDTAQLVDLNTIPSFLIDSVDVVTGGASAVYGSDAMAGVVNFRLKKVEGIELGGQYSLTQEGDGARYELFGAIGTSFDDGRGSATVFAEYYNRESVMQGDRGFSRFALGGESTDDPLQQFGSSTMPATRFNGSPFVATTAAAADTNENGRCDAGEPCAILAQGLVLDDAIFDVGNGAARARAGDTYNYAPANFLQIPQERYLLGGYADYEFTDGHEAYMEVSFVNNRVAQELAPTPVTGTFNIDIATAAQFVSPAVLAQLNQLDANEAAASAARVANGLSALPGAQLGVVRQFIQRRVEETGSRNTLDERNAFRVLTGVRGAVTDWLNYDAYYMYARTRNANVQAGNISRAAFQAGLDGTGTDINIWDVGSLTPEMVDAITITAQNGDISTLEVANAAFSGFLGDLGFGGGDIGFAFGTEYRRVASEFLPDTALSSGDVIGFNAGDATQGAYSVTEFFGELNVPIIETDSGLRLELNGAARYSDYSLEAVGGVWTYAGGVEFQPIQDVTLRGQYQRAVRAPNVGELFGGQAIGFPTTVDPCSNAAFIAANPGASAICVAHGVPAGNVGTAAVQLNTQIPALFGGNPDLQEETSDSWTFGVVLQPRFIPGLTVTADYFDIKIKDTVSIAGGSLQGLMNLCYGEVQDLNSPVCTPFAGIRNLDGAITVDAPPLVAGVNIAQLSVSGIDLEANYSTRVPFSLLTDSGDSSFNLNFLGTWTDSSSFVPVAGLNTIIQCAGEFAGECGEPTPSFKWTSRFSWVDGPLTTSLRWRHLSAVDDDDDTVDHAAFNGIERIGAYDVFDLTFAYAVNERVTFSLGVNNLFDVLPDTPQFDANGVVVGRPNSLLLGDNQEQANTFPSTYDVLGRDFFASVNFKF